MLRTSVRWARSLARRLRREEEGNTLILYPFAVLIVIAVGGLALDTAIFFQAHRESVDVAAGLASDIAGVIDEGAFAENDGAIVIDPVRAEAILLHRNLELAEHPNGLRCAAAIDPLDAATVEVACTGTARPVLGAGVLYDSFSLRGTATASAGSR